MNEKEIKHQISMEEKRLKKLEDDLKGIEFDIEATKKAIEFWKKELDKASQK